MESKWNERDVAAQPELEGLLYASRLVGADQNLVVWGGGNTSAKVVETDFRGRQTRVLRVKGSGSDLRTIQLKDFPGVRLDDVLPLQEREAMSDEVMVAYLAHTLMEPASPRPSIETLLHAFLPARFVIHTHADAILALTNTTRGRELVREALGPGAIWIDYRRPGFALSKQVAEVFAAQPDATSVVLEKHGIITWGDTARAAYEATIAAVTRAEQFVAARRAAALLRPPRSPLTPSPSPTRGEGNEGAVPSALTPPLPAYDSAPPLPWWERGPGGEGLDSPTRRRIYAAIAPLIRGLAGRTTPEGDVLPASEAPEVPPLGRAVLRFDDSPDILAFVSDPAAGRLSQIGPATPDHLVTTRRTPLYVPILPLPLGEAARSAGEVFPLSTGVERGPGGEVPLKQSLEPAWRAWAKDYVRYVQSCAGRVENTAAPSQ
ncbi:MAG: class II aldolase/adducin family protein, partial [Chloroflexi bacterium]|nr:class II aldolase/adducin family protein [Chloroflexota bacterium]